jgi:hypothetical protein
MILFRIIESIIIDSGYKIKHLNKIHPLLFCKGSENYYIYGDLKNYRKALNSLFYSKTWIIFYSIKLNLRLSIDAKLFGKNLINHEYF